MKNYDWTKGFLSGALAVIALSIASQLSGNIFMEDINSNLKILSIIGIIILLIYSAKLFITYFRRILKWKQQKNYSTN